MAQCTDLPCVAGGKPIRNAGGNPTVRSKNTSTPFTAFTGLDGAGQWLGLLGHRTSHHIKALIYTSPVDSEEDLIALLLRQQQPSGSNLAFLSIHISRCCVVVGCISSSVAIHLNIHFFWNGINLFFMIFQWFASFPTLVRHSLTVQSTARMHLRQVVP